MRVAIIASLSLVACTPPSAPPAASGNPPAAVEKREPPPPVEHSNAADDDDEVITFPAIVRVDAEPGSKKLQAVWLERGDGERWIVAYRPEPWLVAFADKPVEVSGGRYIPGGQAVKATHFRIDTLRITDDKELGLFESVGPERTMTGIFAERTGTVGAKDEGERYPVFDNGEAAYELANRPDPLPLGSTVKVRVRETKYSKFAAHRDGPLVWVLEVDGVRTAGKAG